jgi:DNA repair exonuclease SbcCD ATPase subunit
MSRILAVEEERSQLAAECAQLEAALSKQKEDELVALEERYEEASRFKALIREQENAADEASKAARDKERDAKEHKRAADALTKQLQEKTRIVEAAEQQVESLTAKLSKATEDSKKYRTLGEQASTRIRELEEQSTALSDERDALKSQLAEKDAELERATKRRAEAEEEFETERTALKRQIEAAGAATSPAAASAASSPGASDASADLAHTQALLQKRTSEVSELETSLREQRARVRELEEFEERCASLTRQLRDGEASWAKKIEALSREKTELSEELALIKEKRERDRQRAAEREEKEKEARVHSVQQGTELSTQLSTLQRELDVANSKIGELQDAIADKQSKISEQQDKLNSLTRSSDTMGREHAELREEAGALAQRLEAHSKASAAAIAKAEGDKASALEELRQLQQQHEALLARRMIFESIDAATLAAARTAAKDKAHLAQLDALLQKVTFYGGRIDDASSSSLDGLRTSVASASGRLRARTGVCARRACPGTRIEGTGRRTRREPRSQIEESGEGQIQVV